MISSLALTCFLPDSIKKALFRYLKRPSPPYRNCALWTKLLAAETPDAIAIPDLKPLPGIVDGVLWAVALANATLDTKSWVDYWPRGKGVLKHRLHPLRQRPFEMFLGWEAVSCDCDIGQLFTVDLDPIEPRLSHPRFFSGPNDIEN